MQYICLNTGLLPCALEGEVVQTAEGKSDLIIRVDLLGCAQVTINAIDLEPLR